MLLVGSLLGPTAGAASAGSGAPATLDSTLPVHPLLQVGAQLEPDKKVRVIVQKQHQTDDSQAIAHAAGADVKEEFGFIKSLVLEVPQRAVLSLAHNPNVRYISPDGAVRHSSIDTGQLKTTYPLDLNAQNVWNNKPNASATGSGVTIAVLDSGFNASLPDFANAAALCLDANVQPTTCSDANGHGTAVAGVIRGLDTQGRYIGVAPNSQILSIQVLGSDGSGAESDVVRGLQWIFDNRATYNIKVVNLSLIGSVAESYLTAPISGAIEQLWLNGVVVVAAAGNNGSAAGATWYEPGNDPFVISVGALDDNGSAIPTSWAGLATFSSRGLSQDGVYKPEIVAPGRHIVTTLAGPTSTLAKQFPSWIVDTNYISLGGTSLSAPAVSGVAALILQRYNLTPNQLKWLLINSADTYPGQADGAGEVDALKAMQTAATGMLGVANQGLVVNSSLNSTTNTVVSGQTYWNQTYWNQTYWNQTYWNQTYWN